LEDALRRKRLGYWAIAAAGVLFILLIGYEFTVSVVWEGGPIYVSPKHGVEARGIPAVFMYVAMLALGGLLTAYGLRGAFRR
jgi:hypothetical protein